MRLPLANLFRCLPEHPVENLMGKVNGFLDGLPGGYHPYVDLPLPSQPDTGNQARAEVDHATVDFRHVGIGVKHHFLTGRCW